MCFPPVLRHAQNLKRRAGPLHAKLCYICYTTGAMRHKLAVQIEGCKIPNRILAKAQVPEPLRSSKPHYRGCQWNEAPTAKSQLKFEAHLSNKKKS